MHFRNLSSCGPSCQSVRRGPCLADSMSLTFACCQHGSYLHQASSVSLRSGWLAEPAYRPPLLHAEESVQVSWGRLLTDLVRTLTSTNSSAVGAIERFDFPQPDFNLRKWPTNLHCVVMLIGVRAKPSCPIVSRVAMLRLGPEHT